MQVFFETNTVPSVFDPDDVVPDDLVAPAMQFTGGWIYDPAAVDLDPDPLRGRFDLGGTTEITLEIGALTLRFSLDEVTYFYTESGGGSFYTVRGSATESPFPGIATQTIELHFAQASPLPGSLGLVDAPVDPLPGSPWEDGSGSSLVLVSGTNGLSGEAELSFLISNVLGSYQDPVPVPEPATWLLVASGVSLLAWRRAAARRR